MAELIHRLKISTTNGRIKKTTRAKSTKEYVCKDREKENARLRPTKTLSNAEDRIFNCDFKYFLTFTTSDLELSKNGKLFLDAVARYLKRQGATFYIQLEPFQNFDKYGFHIHGFSDTDIDFTKWLKKYGAIKNYAELWENWEKRDKNVYCELIYSSVGKCFSYMNKKIALTKELLGLNKCVYRSNVKKEAVIKAQISEDTETGELTLIHENLIATYVREKNEYLENNTINLSEYDALIAEKEFIQEEYRVLYREHLHFTLYGRKLSKTKQELFDYVQNELNNIRKKINCFNSINSNLDNTVNNTSNDVFASVFNHGVNNKICKNAYLMVEKQEKLYKKTVLKSNTELHESSIPLENGIFFKDFQLLYIGYIENIP